MTNNPSTTSQKLNDSVEKKSLKSTNNEILEFSKIVNGKINREDFNSFKMEKDIDRLISSIREKVNYSCQSLNNNIQVLLGPQQQKDISFLYLWSTINDIVHLRIKITADEWIIFKNEGEKKTIKPKPEIEGQCDNDKNEWKLKNLIRKFIEYNNKNMPVAKFFEDFLVDCIWLVLSFESEKQLNNFKSCREKRNKLLLTHRNIFNRKKIIEFEDIIDMKEIIETLLYLK